MFDSIIKCFSFSILLLIISNCSTSRWKDEVINETPDSYLKGFEIQKYSEFTRITVKNPWQKSEGESFTYILSSKTESVPDSLKEKTIIKTPVSRVIVFSTTHVGFIAALNKSSTIAGVSGSDFINDSIVRVSLEKKECLDIGFAPNIDFESILLLNPDLVFLYGLDASVTSLVKRLGDAGIQSVLVSEFLEDHPLGKAEWIKFFAAFYEMETLSDSIFTEVKNNYLQLMDSAAGFSERPRVLTGLPWKDTWYMSGGKSFAAKLIADAGGDFLWKDDLNTDFIPLDLESVFQKSVNAEIWINTGSAGNLQEIYSMDQRFQYIPAFQNGKVYNNNLMLNPSGGNDFWESGAVRPDKILSDLINIFHHQHFNKQKLYFYKRLE